MQRSPTMQLILKNRLLRVEQETIGRHHDPSLTGQLHASRAFSGETSLRKVGRRPGRDDTPLDGMMISGLWYVRLGSLGGCHAERHNCMAGADRKYADRLFLNGLGPPQQGPIRVHGRL
jgi:hypothetical protein